MMQQYLQIIKPRIIFGNIISVIGGFLLAAKGQIDYALFVVTLVSVSLVIASSCVFNNYIDRDIDQKMKRTKNRALVQKLISPKKSLFYATGLSVIGFTLLYLMTNSLTMWITLLGFIIYVGIYSLYMKRKSIYSTIIGSLAGAMPPVIGYCTVSNQFDTGALILFLIFSLWQMPHFYAIAILHIKDYQIASIPALPVKYGILMTKRHIISYIIGFIIVSLMLTLNGYTGNKYLIITNIVNTYWLYIAVHGYKTKNNDTTWARKLFIFSIIVITTLSIMISLDFKVPLNIN